MILACMVRASDSTDAKQRPAQPSGLWVFTMRKRILCVASCTLLVAGCADLLLSTGSLLGTVGNGLRSIGTCLSPVDAIDLHDVFNKGTALTWSDNAVELSDADQPEVHSFFHEKLGQSITPVHYLKMRFYQLGALEQGEVLEVEPLGDVAKDAYLYDADFRLIYSGSFLDFAGRRQHLMMPLFNSTSSAYLRVDLQFKSERDEAFARITRRTDLALPGPSRQTVVLHFGGCEQVSFRNGYLVPADIGAIDDPVIRHTAAEQFRSVFAPFNVMVLTDADPLPESPYSVIFIGPTQLSTYSYGLAESVDSRNVYADDTAIVDTDQLALSVARALGADLYGRAIGMIAAHEMGHLLGLEHVADGDALMTGAQCQGTGGDIERMLQRELKPAPIIVFASDLRVWTLGYQDAAADLLETVGPAENP